MFITDNSIVLPVIILLSLIQYHFCEMPMQRSSYGKNVIFSTLFALATIILCFIPMQDNVPADILPANIKSVEDSIKYNEYLHFGCNNHLTDCKRDEFLKTTFANVTDNEYSKKCALDLPNKNGKIALLTGNSFIISYAKAIIQAIQKSRHGRKFKKIYTMSQNGCPIFDALNEAEVDGRFYCALSHGNMEKILQKLKPDLFITMSQMEFLNNARITLPANMEDDDVSKSLKDEIKRFAKLAKHVVSLEPNLVINE
uniref:SGNH domain-containing protein n=1 Tax=Panagrolaimus sp. JU765 TaxID=591449 RepID=A0AC34R8P8_9BILA